LKRVCLGKIVSAHGVKGLVKILPFGDDPYLIETLGPVYTDETGSGTLEIIMKNSAGNKYWLAFVKGVTERNGAEALRGTGIWVDKSTLPAIEDKHTFYHADLIGLKTIDESGAEIGEVVSVQNFGAGDLLEIRPQGRDSFYLPFNKANILEVKDQTIAVSIPEGLIT
jgi:16S rRNA processing protein RimM